MQEQLDLSSAENNKSSKYFISYRRSADLDSTLANYLVEELRKKGAEVFIDIEMPVGIKWSEEIERRIIWADFMVVLLSSESISSEMILAEVRRAFVSDKNTGSPKILPIRVNYKGNFGYELDGYIGKLQYLFWKNKNDNKIIAKKIINVPLNLEEVVFDDIQKEKTHTDITSNLKPVSKADMRPLRELIETPGGRLSHDSNFYIHRTVDLIVEEKAKSISGQTLIIKGPNKMGKSSLLLRYLEACHQTDKKVALVDLLTFGSLSNLSFSDFATQFVDTILIELGLENKNDLKLDRALDLTHFMEDEIFPNIEKQIVLAIDEADKLIDCEWKEEFYSVLRTWDSFRSRSTKRETWGKLHIALVISTNPKMLIEDADTSPFNTTIPILLESFERKSIDDLNQSFGNILSSEQLDSLYQLLGGHPYLTPLAFFRISVKEYSFTEILSNNAMEYGPFGEHLRSIFDGIHNAKLIEALKCIVNKRKLPNNDRRLIYRLEAAGLIKEKSGEIIPSNNVYKNFFRAVL